MLDKRMTNTMIPTGTIVLLLFLKVAPPWADTWSDVAWIHKLTSFGNEWSNFNVYTPATFFISVQLCDESEVWDEDNSKWVTFTGSPEELMKLKDDPKTWAKSVSSEVYMELVKLRKAFKLTVPEVISTKVRVKKDYSQWALASVLPLLVSLLFTLVVWWREEKGWTKVLLFPVVFIGLYSQYRAIKIILIGLGKWPNRRMEEWQEEKARFTREIASIEPVSEALPSFLIQLMLLSTELAALGTTSQSCTLRTSPLGDNPYLFIFSFSLSTLLAVMGLNHFLKDGPCPIISSSQGYLDGFISKDFGALFFTTFLWFTAKCLILSHVVQSKGSKGSIFGIEVPDSVPIATILWVSTLVLPHLIHAVIVLAKSTGWNIFSLILSFPSFIITPLFTPFVFKGSCSDGKYNFRVSIKQTIINITLTFLLTALTMILYYDENFLVMSYTSKIPSEITYDMKQLINLYQYMNDTVHANMYKYILDVTINYIQIYAIVFVILPPIFLIFSLLPTCHLLNNCFNGRNKSGKHRTNLKFCKIGRLTWQVKPEGDDSIEMVAVHIGDLQDQQADGLQEGNLDLTNSRSNKEIEDKVDYEEGGNNLEFQKQDNLADS